MLEDIKRGLEKGPVSMETVDKRVRLDVDAGKAVKELLTSIPKWRFFTSFSVLDILKEN